MSQHKILVTGATGKTGRETVKLLLDRGHAVRALVHREDERAAALAKLGAEIVLGDLLDFESVRAAMEGMQTAYFVYPIRPGILQGTAYFAQAGKEAGLKAIVNMSQASARRIAKSHAAQDHWIAERVFDWSGVPVTHLRPTLFAEWILYWADFIKAGFLPLPFGSGRHAPIAAEDQARVIANILVAPEEHQGKTYPLFGAKETTFPEMAQELGRILGKAVQYQVTDVPSLAKLAKEHGKPLPDFFWQHITEIAIDHQNGVFAGANDLVEKIGGRPPLTLEAFVTLNRAQLVA
jgi:uncharacterized protein YbjT (DUF2867 family)